MAIHACSQKKCSEPQSLKEQMLEENFPKVIKSPYNISIFWIDKALAPPQLRMIIPIRDPVQKTLWKIALGLGPNKLWNGNYTKDNKKIYTFRFEKT